MFLLTTGDVLDDTQQAAFQRYIEARRRLRRRPLGRRHRARLAVVRRPRRRVLREPPGDPDGGRSPSPTRATPRRRCFRRSGREPTSGTTSRPTRGRRCTCCDARRAHLRPGRRRDGRRPSDRLVARLRRRPAVVHGARPHRRDLRRAALPGSLLGGIRYAASPLPGLAACATAIVSSRTPSHGGRVGA